MAVKVFVSGTFDILHAGHIQFFKDAKDLGDELIVNFCSEKNLMLYKGRVASMPDDNKKVVLESIKYIDKVYQGTDDGGVWDFVVNFLKENPDILAITTDDNHAEEKELFCSRYGAELVVLSKSSGVTKTSTTEIRNKINAKEDSHK